jgi:hypothetical protein
MLRRCHWVRGYLCRADSRSLATLKVCSGTLPLQLKGKEPMMKEPKPGSKG